MKKAVLLGVTASSFFAFTFILNRQMNLHGGSWMWTSSLRYIFTLPMLFVIMLVKRQLIQVIDSIREKPAAWIIWSTVGFGIFYAPLSFASQYGTSWIIAGTWQITIVAGALLSPLFFKTVQNEKGTFSIRNKIPRKVLLISTIILLGIFLMQFQQARNSSGMGSIWSIIPVVLAAFAYPLGNRKMIELCENKLDTFQRVFGMVLCSMPFWIILSLFGFVLAGAPKSGQILQCFIVALCSGVIATTLFFKATDIASCDIKKLAAVESTQSGEVIFTLLGGVLIFHDTVPTGLDLAGISLVVVGMILNSCITANIHTKNIFLK